MIFKVSPNPNLSVILYAGCHPAGKQFGRKGPGDLGGVMWSPGWMRGDIAWCR